MHEHIEAKLPRLWADERALRQIILNLLNNAIKFTETGGVSVVVEPGADGRLLPPAQLATLFFPAGAAGPAFLLTENYWIIKQYNNSDSYAMSVARLGDRLELSGDRAVLAERRRQLAHRRDARARRGGAAGADGHRDARVQRGREPRLRGLARFPARGVGTANSRMASAPSGRRPAEPEPRKGGMATVSTRLNAESYNRRVSPA